MKGTQYIRLKADNYSYDLALPRKISILKGLGGTGKTTLVSTILQANASSAIIQNTSSKKLVPIGIVELDAAISIIQSTKDAIIVLDEGNDWVTTNRFAEAVNKSDNYFLIITREWIKALTYSVDSIYELETDSNNVHRLKQLYQGKNHSDLVPDKIICEDEKSGFILFKLIDTTDSKAMTAKGKNNVLNLVEEECSKDKNLIIAIFADGAAFGSQIEKYFGYYESYRIVTYLPECFEFMLLRSKIFENNPKVQAVLADPIGSIESSYKSGENYFEKLLLDAMHEIGMNYEKKELSRCFTDKCCHRYKPCKAVITDEEYDKLQELIKEIPIDLSKIYIDGKLNGRFIELNKKNIHGYQIPKTGK